MVAAALNRTGILSIVDVILIICGIYCMVTAGKMKKNHVLPQWLFTEQELHQIRHPEKFCEEMGLARLVVSIFAMKILNFRLACFGDPAAWIAAAVFTGISYLYVMRKSNNLILLK